MKTPPDRTGIKFEVGVQLQARDRHKNWYSATIDKVDYDKERVLIHFRRWSHRHDEWFHWNSPYLRPLERISLRRRRGLDSTSMSTSFVPGNKVLACWTDCRFYPAKVLRVNNDDSYTVRFYDGVVRTVKPTKVKALQKKSKCGKKAVGGAGLDERGSEEECEEGEKEEEEEEKEEKPESKGGPHMSSSASSSSTSSSSLPPHAVEKSLSLSPDGNNETQKQPVASEMSQSAVSNPTHVEKDVLLERQAHLPTTHKFSREPLYRVIKNQPPPILSIELDHNPFKCSSAGCTKSFRKASLLHYHIKYYHAEQQQLEEQSSTTSVDLPRRKRSSSEEGQFLYDMTSVTCHRDEKEHRIMGTAEMKRDKTFHHRKERKNFLRVKLKKKKKKKKKKKTSQSEVCSSDNEGLTLSPIMFKLSEDHPSTHTLDDGSDWSTLTAESGEDAPFWSFTTGTEDYEVVRCVCEVDEENDFMIQCESCLCWQHGTCMGLYEDNVPRNYICYHCRHCRGWRRAQCYLSEPDLLTSGHMFGLSFVRENYSDSNASTIMQTSGLLAHTHSLNQALSGLQLKISLLRAPSHPDLQLWRLPWKLEEEQKPIGEAPISYVSSEHCYQKPGASWEKAKDKPMITVKQDLGDEGDKEIKREDTICLEGEWPSQAKKAKHLCTNGDEGDMCARQATPPTSVTVCQLNLLEHVEGLHQQISTRMDIIEKDIDVLESWLDHSGELEPPEPLSRLPQLKQRIRRLLHDLSIVRQLSARHWHSS